MYNRRSITGAIAALLLVTTSSSSFAKGDKVLTKFGYATRSASAYKRNDAIPSRRSLEEAIRVANAQLSSAKRTGDAIAVGRAKAMLSDYWNSAEPSTALLTIKADIQQYDHQFDAAKATLAELVRKNPLDDNARLSLANIQLLSGEYKLAMQQCMGLRNNVASVVCKNQVIGFTDAPGKVARTLIKEINQFGTVDSEMGAWAASVLAELYARAGEKNHARTYAKAATKLAPKSRYYRTQYADLLLQLGDYKAVSALLKRQQEDTAMALRLAIAQKAMGFDSAELTAKVRAEFSLDSGTDHYREAAIFHYFVDKDFEKARTAALKNFKEQKEPIDILLLDLVSSGEQGVEARAVLKKWQTDKRYIDKRLGA